MRGSPRLQLRLRRFWGRVNKNGPDHPLLGRCWIWIGACILKGGYGTVIVDGKTLLTHRRSWEMHYGNIPEEMRVLHKCDNPPCVNPSHLFLGTYADNNKDRNEKERQAVGEVHGMHKLTEELVKQLREEYRLYPDERNKYGFFSSVASRYGLHVNTVRSMIYGKTWRHIL